MAAETIREFLVALGFKVDQPTLKKFEDAMTGATFKAHVLADAFVGMAKAIAENIRNATKDLDNLYYTSIRVGSSATNLKALGQASQDFGVSTEEALGNIEALAQALRTDPGTEAFINHLGVRTRNANRELRDTVDIANDLGRALSNKPDFMANQLAELVGITYKFQRMVRDPGWLQDLEKHQKLLASGDYENAARSAAVLEQQWRELGDRWDALKKRSEVRLFGPLIEEFQQLSDWLDKHGPDIERYISGFTHAVGVAGKIALPILGKIAEGWGYIFDGVKRLGDYIAGSKIGDSVGKAFGWLIDKLGIKDVVDEELGLKPRSAASAARTAGGKEAFGISVNNPGNLEYRGQEGATRAAGGPGVSRFAAFRTPQEGLDAMARQLGLDFHRGRGTLEALISKYAPPEENDTAAYIADVAGKLHTGSRSPLNLNDPALLGGLMNAMITHEQNSNPYRPEDVRSAAQKATQGNGVNVTQHNNITINGVKDAGETKRAVSDALQDSYRKLTRNLQPTAQ